jgi:hypothetical protein
LAGVVSLNVLHTFTYIYDGTTVQGLIDGTEVVTGMSVGNLPTVSQPLR